MGWPVYQFTCLPRNERNIHVFFKCWFRPLKLIDWIQKMWWLHIELSQLFSPQKSISHHEGKTKPRFCCGFKYRWNIYFLFCWDSIFSDVLSWEPPTKRYPVPGEDGKLTSGVKPVWNFYTPEIWWINIQNGHVSTELPFSSSHDCLYSCQISAPKTHLKGSQIPHQRFKTQVETSKFLWWRKTTNRPGNCSSKNWAKLKKVTFFNFANGESWSWGILKAFRRLRPPFWPFKMDVRFNPESSVPEPFFVRARRHFPFSPTNLGIKRLKKIGKPQKWIPILLSKWVSSYMYPFPHESLDITLPPFANQRAPQSKAASFPRDQ